MDFNQTDNRPAPTGIVGGLTFSLLVVSLIAWFSFQLYQSLQLQDALNKTLQSQQTPVQEANKTAQGLSSLAMGTKQLANQGNANAATIVNALAQRGVNIADQKPQQPPAPAP